MSRLTLIQGGGNKSENRKNTYIYLLRGGGVNKYKRLQKVIKRLFG